MATLVTDPTTTPVTEPVTEPVVDPQPQTTPTLDWQPHVPKGAEKTFESYKGKSLTEVLNGVVEAQKLIGGSIRLPKADAPVTERDKVMGEVYNKLGRPETPDKYDLGELPALGETMKWDDARMNAAKGALHKAGLSNDQAKAVMGLYASEMQTLFPDPTTVAHASRAKLIEEYGSESLYNRNMGFAKKAVAAYGTKEFIAWLDSTGMGNNIEFVKYNAKLGRELIEHGAVDPATPTDLISQAEAQNKVTTIMNDPKDLYFSKPGTPGKVERMKEVEELFKIVAGEA